MKAIYVNLVNFDINNMVSDVQIVYSDGSSASTSTWPVDFSACRSYDAIRTAINAVVIANAPSTITEADIQQPSLSALAGAFKNAPQAAIVNAPADAVTNYNVVTTLLGSLTGAVNTANGKQNDIATKLNSLLTELRTLGLIAP